MFYWCPINWEVSNCRSQYLYTFFFDINTQSTLNTDHNSSFDIYKNYVFDINTQSTFDTAQNYLFNIATNYVFNIDTRSVSDTVGSSFDINTWSASCSWYIVRPYQW